MRFRRLPALMLVSLLPGGCGPYAAAPMPDSVFPAQLLVRAEGGAWSARVDPNWITLQTSGNEAGAREAEVLRVPAIRTDHAGQSVIVAQAGETELLLILRDKPCGAERPGKAGAWQAERQHAGKVEPGCAMPVESG